MLRLTGTASVEPLTDPGSDGVEPRDRARTAFELIPFTEGAKKSFLNQILRILWVST
jgi:hypothetical protein